MERTGKIHDNKKSDGIVWRTAAGQKIFDRQWDGDGVFFSSHSGETHILDVSSSMILRRIMEGPSTIEDIRARFAEFLEVENDSRLANAVDEILERLAEAGLVEPAV